MQITAFRLALDELWAIKDEDQLRTLLEIANREHDWDLEAVEAVRARRLENAGGASLRDGVAIIPMVGPIFRYANLFTQISGATAIETTALNLRVAVEDPKVRGILLNVDSPGGTVSGTNELSKMVKLAAAKKPLVAYVSAAGASGAYWIASAANAIFADETAELGSIGVLGVFEDTAKRDRARGIERVTFVSSDTPLKRPEIDTDEGRAAMQKRVDDAAEVFIKAVATNRGVLPDTIIEKFGRGGVLAGEDAVKVGMADGISMFEDVLAGLAAGRMGGVQSRPIPISSLPVEAPNPDARNRLPSPGAASDQETIKDAKALAAEARQLVSAAEERGERLSVAAAVQSIVDAGAGGPNVTAAATAAKKRPGAAAPNKMRQVAGPVSLEGVRALKSVLVWKNNRAIRAQFGEMEYYQAFLSAKHDGSISMRGHPRVGGEVVSLADEPLSGDISLPLETRAGRAWDGDPALRAEFGGNFDAWLSYTASLDAARAAASRAA